MNRVLVKEFYNWLGTQSGPYQTRDNCTCPMAEFAKTQGLQHPIARIDTVDEGTGETETIDDYSIPLVKQTGVLDFGAGVYYAINQTRDYETLRDIFPSRFPEVLA